MLIVNPDHLDKIRRRFDELSSVIADTSSTTRHLFENMMGSFEKFSDQLQDSSLRDSLVSLKSLSTVIHKSTEDLVSMTSTVNKKLDDSLGGFAKVLDTSSKGLENATKKLTEAEGMSQVQPARHEGTDIDGGKGKPSVVGGYMKKEGASLGGKIKNLWGSLKMPSPGNIMATGVLWMTYGTQDSARVQAEAGEVKNIIVTATDGTIKKVVDKATAQISTLQESLQKFWGIAKEEVQGVTRSFADGGVKARDFTAAYEQGIKGVENTVTTFALGVDKMLELAGGTTAKSMVGLMENYAYSTKEAADAQGFLLDKAAASGIGYIQFLKNVETAAEPLKRFGLESKEVAVLSTVLQDSFSKLGVPRQFAGRQAAMGMQQLSSGISNLKDDWKSLIAEEMGMGSGVSGVVAFDEMVLDIKKGNDDRLTKLIIAAVNISRRATEGDVDKQKLLLSQNLGLGPAGARAALEISEAYMAGDVKKAKELTNKHKALLAESYTTEREKRNVFQLEMNKWMKGLSMIGNAMLASLLEGLALLIMYFKALPALFTNALSPATWSKNAEIFKDIATFSSGMNSNKGGFAEGASLMGDAMRGMGMQVLGDSMGNLSAAMKYNPYEGLGGQQAGLGGSGAVPAMPMVVRNVTIPAAGGKVAQFSSSPNEAAMAVGDDEADSWVGGSMYIMSNGVDNSGNILLSLEGNCPKCGLLFGTTTASTVGSVLGNSISMTYEAIGNASAKDVEAVARMITSEVGSGRWKKFDSMSEKDRNELLNEAAGKGWVALNRLRSGKYGDSLTNVIAGKSGTFGKQGKKGRAFSTIREADPKAKALAEEILRGNVQDVSKGAIGFFDQASPQHLFGGKRWMGKWFAGLKNVENIGTTRFYGTSGAEDEEKMERDEKMKRKFTEWQAKKAKDELAGTAPLHGHGDTYSYFQ